MSDLFKAVSKVVLNGSKAVTEAVKASLPEGWEVLKPSTNGKNSAYWAELWFFDGTHEIRSGLPDIHLDEGLHACLQGKPDPVSLGFMRYCIALHKQYEVNPQNNRIKTKLIPGQIFWVVKSHVHCNFKPMCSKIELDF